MAPPPVDKSRYNLFNPVPDDQLRAFASDRPNKGTGPTTVDAGRFQIETDLLYALHDGYSVNQTTTRQFIAGDPVLKLGITNHVDLEIGLGGYQAFRVTDRNAGTTHRFDGFGDVTVRAKVNLLGNDGGAVAVALIPFFKIPTASRDVGNAAGEWGLTIPVQFQLPLNIVALVVTEFDDYRNLNNFGRHAGFTNLVNLNAPLTATVTAGVEVWSQVQASHIPAQSSLDFSLAWMLGENTQLDAAAYIGMNKATPDLVAYAGVSRRF